MHFTPARFLALGAFFKQAEAAYSSLLHFTPARFLALSCTECYK